MASVVREECDSDLHTKGDLGGAQDGEPYAERHGMPILTFDFEDFRATRPSRGYWRLIIDEGRYRSALRDATKKPRRRSPRTAP